jgi:hypothetical protein
MELILGYSSRIAAIVDCLVVSAIALADSFVPRPAPHPTPEVTQAVAHWSTQQKNTVRWAHPPVYPSFWNAPLGPNQSNRKPENLWRLGEAAFFCHAPQQPKQRTLSLQLHDLARIVFSVPLSWSTTL